MDGWINGWMDACMDEWVHSRRGDMHGIQTLLVIARDAGPHLGVSKISAAHLSSTWSGSGTRLAETQNVGTVDRPVSKSSTGTGRPPVLLHASVVRKRLPWEFRLEPGRVWPTHPK